MSFCKMQPLPAHCPKTPGDALPAVISLGWLSWFWKGRVAQPEWSEAESKALLQVLLTVRPKHDSASPQGPGEPEGHSDLHLLLWMSLIKEMPALWPWMMSDLKGVSGNFIIKVRKIHFCKDKKIYESNLQPVFLFIPGSFSIFRFYSFILINTDSVKLLT